jgi:hydrogenase nickel incorporation protein HypA/HybF
MHELSIATAIAGVARRHAGGRRVRRVEVKVGHLRQVVPASLLFNWSLVCKDTHLEGAELALEEVPARGRCRRCGETSELPGFPLACAACGALDVEVVAGEELLVEALEIDDESDDETDDNVIHQESWPSGTRRTA